MRDDPGPLLVTGRNCTSATSEGDARNSYWASTANFILPPTIPPKDSVSQSKEEKQQIATMIDFIFQVDLSTIYIIHRRDYYSPIDKAGTSTLPLGGKFYYTAAEANAAARQYCLREATKAGTSQVVHGDKASLYRGVCHVREQGRDKFEVIVRRLTASGNGAGAMRGESRGSVMVGTGRTEDGRPSRSERRPRTAESVAVGTGRGSSEAAAGKRLSLGERRPEMGTLTEVEEESSSRESSVSATEKRQSRIGRFWGTLRKK